MSREYLALYPRDPIIARDGRPFAAGNRMRPVDWFYPSVFAGAWRTSVGASHNRFDPVFLRGLEVAGAFPCKDGFLYLPFPKDCVLRETPAAALPVCPDPSYAGCTNLDPQFAPCLLPSHVQDDFKPLGHPAFLSITLLTHWLLNSTLTMPLPAGETQTAFPLDERIHVSIKPSTLTSEESMLFITAGIAFPPGWTLEMRVSGRQTSLPVQPIGGERRTVFWQQGVGPAQGWSCPSDLSQSLASARYIRMMLATPALFRDGWIPGWLRDEQLVPGSQDLKLKLIGAAVDRARPVSGWSLEHGRRGPKPARRMAPAGSVYFCEVLSGSPSQLPNLWLEPVSDDAQDRLDGFGLALWGTWQQ